LLIVLKYPRPSCPSLFEPQPQIVPSFFNAIECMAPVEMWVIPLIALTWPGALLLVEVPFPNCPSSLIPHELSVPSLQRLKVKFPPPEIDWELIVCLVVCFS
jgi:hypothetical protein